jgi:DNA repair protein RadC
MRTTFIPHTAQESFEDLLFFDPLAPTTAPNNSPDFIADQYSVPVYRIQLVREGEQSLLSRPRIASPEDAARVFETYLADRDREVFAVLLLDIRCRYIGLNTVSIGTLNSALVHPREVFKVALLTNAASVIVAHNHPSGDAEPSPEDRMVTQRLVEAGKVLGIDVADHLVIGERGRFFSLKSRGLM